MSSSIPAAINVAPARYRSDDRRQRVLGRCAMFSGLDDHLRRQLIENSALINADRRDDLCMPNDDALFVIGTGRVRRIHRTTERDLTLGYYGPGELIGEMKLVDPAIPLDVVALEYVEALRIPAKVMRLTMARDVEFAALMFKLMGDRRRQAERRIEGLLTRSVESRVAEFLLEAAQHHGIPDARGVLLGVKFTHQEIASYVGSTRETVTLVLGAFKKDGLITTGHRRIVLMKREMLEARI